MQYSEKYFIDLCKTEIEKKLKSEGSESWKQRDYEYLSELIYESTNVLLSLSTLKRIWKKDYDSSPHIGTLNALAKFLDHENWHDYKRNRAGEKTAGVFDTAGLKKSILKKITYAVGKSVKRNALIYRYGAVMAVLICIIAGTLLISAYNLGPATWADYDSVVFTSKKVVTSGLPNSVVFNYDISGIDSDSIFIQQSWDSRRRARLKQENSHHTSLYYYPGFHKAKLIVDGTVIRQHNIHITTDGWLTLARENFSDLIPVYITQGQIFSDGKMYVSPETLQANKVNTSGNSHNVSFYNAREFGGLDSDNFSLEARLKNDLSEGGLTGQYSNVIIMCENSRMLIPMTIPGLISNINMKFSEKWILGKENDLTAFGCDMSVWNDIKCEVRDRNVTIILNGKKIYELTYNDPAGRIIGLQFQFLGCGAVDYVKLFDETNAAVLDENFSG